MVAANLAMTAGLATRSPQSCWDAKFKTLVTFGDSFTDEKRLGYFIDTKGVAPPVGTDLGIVSHLFISTPGLNNEDASVYCVTL